MWKSYIVSAIRSFAKNFQITLINLIGLTVAFTACLLISMYVYKQLNFDRFNENYHDIYRVELGDWAINPSGVAPMIKENLPEIEKVTRISVSWWANIFNYNNDIFSVENVIYSDNDFFDIFSIKVLQGDKKNLLNDPFSMVITEELAVKIFKDENPIGKSIKFNNNYSFTISGVIENRDDFHVQYSAIADFTSLKDLRGGGEESFLTSLGPRNYLVYILSKHNNKQELESKINAYFMGKGYWNEDNPPDFWLRDFSNIYLDDNISYEMGCVHGNRKVVVSFIVIAIFILVIAGINYINITTARGLSRSKEVGVRKILGSGRARVFAQFIIESVFLSVIAFLISIIISSIVAKPLFVYLTGSEMNISQLPGSILSGIILLMLLTGILAAVYPSLFMSAISPLKIFKSGSGGMGKKAILRQILIVLQFSISIVLIIGALTINKQYRYMKNANLGFNPNQVLTMHLERDIRKNRDAIKDELLKNPNVVGITCSQQVPGTLRSTASYNKDDIKQTYRYEYIDPNYVDLFELEISKGRNLSWDRAGDQMNSWLINETALEKFHLNPDSVIGTKIRAYGGEYEIIGVLKDYHFNSLHEEIVPLVMYWHNDGLIKMNVKISTQNITETIKYINSVWTELAPGYPFEYEFLDERFEKAYQQEERLSTMFTAFAALAIVIAIIGIYGLASYMAEQNTRQISIRKVYGASLKDVVTLFTKEFLYLVLIANVIAWPIAYYIMDSWLQRFPYQTKIGIMVFVFSGLLSILLSVLTVAFHASKTANKNPAEVLRYE